MNKKTSYYSVSLLILIIVIVCSCTVLLDYISSLNDYRLALKQAELVKEHYRCHNDAIIWLNEIDKNIDGEYSTTIKYDSGYGLEVRIVVENNRYSIESWKYFRDWQEDTKINVWGSKE